MNCWSSIFVTGWMATYSVIWPAIWRDST